MSRRFPSAIQSSFATFGYSADGFTMSMVDVVGVMNDDSAVPAGEACVIGSAPIGLFATLAPGTVAFHRNDPDVWDFMMPWEVRTVFDKNAGIIMVWDPSVDRYAWRTVTLAGGSGSSPGGFELPSGSLGDTLRLGSNVPDTPTVIAGPAMRNLPTLAIVLDDEEMAETQTSTDPVYQRIINGNTRQIWVRTTDEPDSEWMELVGAKIGEELGYGTFYLTSYRNRLYYQASSDDEFIRIPHSTVTRV